LLNGRLCHDSPFFSKWHPQPCLCQSAAGKSRKKAYDRDHLNGVIPTFEAHVTTPLNHRNNEALITVPDLVILTSGVHFNLARRSRLTLGVATPVTGPTPFSVEAVAQFNWLF
jgi:hypothetical protein